MATDSRPCTPPREDEEKDEEKDETTPLLRGHDLSVSMPSRFCFVAPAVLALLLLVLAVVSLSGGLQGRQVALAAPWLGFFGAIAMGIWAWREHSLSQRQARLARRLRDKKEPEKATPKKHYLDTEAPGATKHDVEEAERGEKPVPPPRLDVSIESATVGRSPSHVSTRLSSIVSERNRTDCPAVGATSHCPGSPYTATVVCPYSPGQLLTPALSARTSKSAGRDNNAAGKVFDFEAKHEAREKDSSRKTSLQNRRDRRRSHLIFARPPESLKCPTAKVRSPRSARRLPAALERPTLLPKIVVDKKSSRRNSAPVRPPFRPITAQHKREHSMVNTMRGGGSRQTEKRGGETYAKSLKPRKSPEEEEKIKRFFQQLKGWENLSKSFK